MSISPAGWSALLAGKYKKNIKDSPGPSPSISHTTADIFPRYKGPQTQTRGRVFLVWKRERKREREWRYHITTVHLFPQAFFFLPPHPTLLQPIKFWSTFFSEKNKEKGKKNYGWREKFNILFHSFLILAPISVGWKPARVFALWQIWLWLVNTLLRGR